MFDRIVQLLTKGLKMDPKDVAEIPERELKLLDEVVPADVDVEVFAKAMNTDEGLDAIAAGDGKALAAVFKAMKKSKKADEDEEDEDAKDGGEKDDFEDAANTAASELWDEEEEDEDEDEEEEKPKKSKKSMRSYLEDEGLDEVVDVEEILRPMLKGFAKYTQARDEEILADIKAIRKSQRELREAMLDLAEAAGFSPPAGPSRPYRVKQPPSDASAAEAAPGNVAGDVATTLLKAQAAGIVDVEQSMRLTAAAQHGGEVWAEFAEEYEGIRKALKPE